jgi:hypothetical protein
VTAVNVSPFPAAGLTETAVVAALVLPAASVCLALRAWVLPAVQATGNWYCQLAASAMKEAMAVAPS